MRMMSASGVWVNWAPRMVRLALPSSALRSISALESNTIHSVSARLKTAAAVGVVNANDSFRLAPWRLSSAATLPLVLAARGRGRGGGAALAAGLSGAAAVARRLAGGGAAGGGISGRGVGG